MQRARSQLVFSQSEHSNKNHKDNRSTQENNNEVRFQSILTSKYPPNVLTMPFQAVNLSMSTSLGSRSLGAVFFSIRLFCRDTAEEARLRGRVAVLAREGARERVAPPPR
jgi:hypothetical protein